MITGSRPCAVPATGSPRGAEGDRNVREIGQELTLIAGLALTALLGALLLGHTALFFGAAAGLYLAWHAANLLRLLHWLRRGRFRTPMSYGLWERVFDGWRQTRAHSAGLTINGLSLGIGNVPRRPP